MRKISRNIYRMVFNDTESLKAIAMLIFVKEHKPTSVIPNFSYYKLAKLTGIHKNTCKKYVSLLADMELVEYTGKKNQHLKFKKIRASKSNIEIDKIDKRSVKTITLGLQALLIVEIQNQKNFIEQQIDKATEPKKNDKKKDIVKAIKFCKHLRGDKKFHDYGISYNTIAKKLNVGLNKVSEIVKHGIERRMFDKRTEVIVCENNIWNASLYIQQLGRNDMFANKANNKVLRYACNKYILP